MSSQSAVVRRQKAIQKHMAAGMTRPEAQAFEDCLSKHEQLMHAALRRGDSDQAHQHALEGSQAINLLIDSINEARAKRKAALA